MGILLVGIAALVALTAVDASLFPPRSAGRAKGAKGESRTSAPRRLRPDTYQDQPVKAFGRQSQPRRSAARWWWES